MCSASINIWTVELIWASVTGEEVQPGADWARVGELKWSEEARRARPKRTAGRESMGERDITRGRKARQMFRLQGANCKLLHSAEVSSLEAPRTLRV